MLVSRDVQDLPVLDSLAEHLEPGAGYRAVAARIDENVGALLLVVLLERVALRIRRRALSVEQAGDPLEGCPVDEEPRIRERLGGSEAGSRVRARVVRVRPDLLAAMPRGVDQLEVLRRARDVLRRSRVLAVVAAGENHPVVDVVRAAVPEVAVLRCRPSGDDKVAACEARVGGFRLLLDDLEASRPGLVHPPQVRIRAEPTVLLPEPAHGAEIAAPFLRLERGLAADVRAGAPAVVRDRDPHRGELARFPGRRDHLPRLVEPPLATVRVALPGVRVAVAPVVRREPVGGEEVEQPREGLVSGDAIEGHHLRAVGLRREVEGRQQTAGDLVRRGQGHRRDGHAERDRPPDPVGDDHDRAAVRARRSAGRHRHL